MGRVETLNALTHDWCLYAGGVHAMQSHAAAIANIVNEAGVPVAIHAVWQCSRVVLSLE